jgi:hypothetical protein
MGVGELLGVAPKLIVKRPEMKFIFCGVGCKILMLELLNAFEEGDIKKAESIAETDNFIT